MRGMSGTEAESIEDDRVVNALEEIARWIRFLGWKQAKDVISQNVVSEDDKAIYFLSDGRPTREIGKILGIPHITVSRRWNDWYSLGLMRNSRRFRGRKEAVFTFSELGMQMPDRVKSLNQSDSPVEERSDQSEATPLTSGNAVDKAASD